MANIFRKKKEEIVEEKSFQTSSPSFPVPSVPPSSDNSLSSNILEYRNITQIYKEKKRVKTEDGGKKKVEVENIVFQNFNFSIVDVVNKGQAIAIMGPSGCGKSTLLRYASNLQKPTSGEILLYGKPLGEEDRIPMVFQQYSSFPWKTVLENVALPLLLHKVAKEEAFERAMAMIKVVGLEGHEYKWAKYPLLSGGQLQRVAVARNLVANPRFLLLDEPFGALDVINKKQMRVFLRKLFQENNGIDPTMITVTHEITDAVFLADKIYILDANPATIRFEISVDLPNHREASLRNTPKFVEIAQYVDECLSSLEKKA